MGSCKKTGSLKRRTKTGRKCRKKRSCKNGRLKTRSGRRQCKKKRSRKRKKRRSYKMCRGEGEIYNQPIPNLNDPTFRRSSYVCGTGLVNTDGKTTKSGVKSDKNTDFMSCWIFNDLVRTGGTSQIQMEGLPQNQWPYRIQCIEHLLPLTKDQLVYFIRTMHMHKFFDGTIVNGRQITNEQIQLLGTAINRNKQQIIALIWGKIIQNRARQQGVLPSQSQQQSLPSSYVPPSSSSDQLALESSSSDQLGLPAPASSDQLALPAPESSSAGPLALPTPSAHDAYINESRGDMMVSSSPPPSEMAIQVHQPQDQQFMELNRIIEQLMAEGVISQNDMHGAKRLLQQAYNNNKNVNELTNIYNNLMVHIATNMENDLFVWKQNNPNINVNYQMMVLEIRKPENRNHGNLIMIQKEIIKTIRANFRR